MRLTEKCKNNYAVKKEMLRVGKDALLIANELTDKLGQLEDIEEELGIDLLTLFKALKDGIWTWNDKDHKEHFFEKPLGLTKFVMEDKFEEKETKTYRLVGVDYYELKDYGKTWALTKEELL